jgi:hypothetical protein
MNRPAATHTWGSGTGARQRDGTSRPKIVDLLESVAGSWSGELS